MLEKQDIAILKGMFDLQKESIVTGILLEVRDMMQNLRRDLRKEISLDIAEFLETSILPQIDDHSREIVRIKRHINLA